MPREVDLLLKTLLQERGSEITQLELAEALNIGRANVSGYLENRWTVLDRNVLERMADFLECDASALLATRRESSFFAPFRTLSGKEPSAGSPFCTYVTRPDADVVDAGRGLAYRDHNAVGRIETLLRDCIDRMTGREVSAETASKFQTHIQQNCVVIGSPMVNSATERAIAYAFGIEPFNPVQSTKLPFTFRLVSTAPGSASSVTEFSPDGKRGIWVREENELIEVDYWPPTEFRKRRIPQGRDCAVVIVLNHETQGLTRCVRKLIVLAGFSGVGTEAAATAVVDHYRDLEPIEGEKLVWGLLDVSYRKSANSTTRLDLKYKWLYRDGGRCPIAFVTR